VDEGGGFGPLLILAAAVGGLYWLYTINTADAEAVAVLDAEVESDRLRDPSVYKEWSSFQGTDFESIAAAKSETGNLYRGVL
jgi:hypothetical protein